MSKKEESPSSTHTKEEARQAPKGNASEKAKETTENNEKDLNDEIILTEKKEVKKTDTPLITKKESKENTQTKDIEKSDKKEKESKEAKQQKDTYKHDDKEKEDDEQLISTVKKKAEHGENNT